MDPRWQTPFTCLVAGPSGAGKTVFVTKFIRFLKEMTHPPPEEVVWCYGEWQEGYRETENVIFQEGLPNEDQWTDGKSRLLIIDDLMAETDHSVTRLFTKGSHHRNISVMLIVQNLFFKNKESRTISLNSHYMVLFKNPRDASQITQLAKQMYPGKTRWMQEAYKDATSRPFGYLLVDLRQSTPEHLRLRSHIFPDEQPQEVYLERCLRN